MPDAVELRRDFLVSAPGALAAPIMAWEPGCLSTLEPVVTVIGAFDGVHLGHRSLIDSAVADGRLHGWRTVAVTFDPDPDTVVSTCPALKLTTHDDRLSLLAAPVWTRCSSYPSRPSSRGSIMLRFSRRCCSLPATSAQSMWGATFASGITGHLR